MQGTVTLIYMYKSQYEAFPKLYKVSQVAAKLSKSKRSYVTILIGPANKMADKKFTVGSLSHHKFVNNLKIALLFSQFELTIIRLSMSVFNKPT